jgi:ABC-type multidrug transport system fused ATPase/permease subunit
MRRSLERLLLPVARALWWYTGLIVLRELVRLGGAYSMSATFRFLDFSRDRPGAWYQVLFLGALALYFELELRVNSAALWHSTTRISTPLYKHMRMGAVRKFLALPLHWHQRHNSAVLAGEVNNGIERVHELVNSASWELAPLVAATLLSVVPLVWFSPLSLAVLLFCGAFSVFLNYRIFRLTEPYRVARCDSQSLDWKLSSEYVRGLPAMLMANRTAHAIGEFERVQDRLAANVVEEYRYEAFRHGRWRDRIVGWTHVALIAVWLHQLRAQTLSLVDCVYVWRISEDLLSYLETYSSLFEQMAGNTEPVKRYLAFLGEPEPERAAAGAVEQPAPEQVRIDVRNLVFRHPGQAKCLEGVNARFSPGEITALVGPTGCGKSTLVKLLCGLYEPQSGDILLNGRDALSWWSPEQVRSLISYVPQLNEAGVFERSVADNIRFAVPDAPMDRVVEAATAAGLHQDILELPAGYDTIVGESGSTLSGGQLQRLVLARELLKDSPVLILDEPSSAQDSRMESRLLETLLPRLRHKTVILISHRLSLVRRAATRVLAFENGRIVEAAREQADMRLRARFMLDNGSQVWTDSQPNSPIS